MASDLSSRDQVIAEWCIYESVGHATELPTAEALLVYCKTLIEIVAADGVLHKDELKWIVGLAAACGAPQGKLDQLKNYKPGQSEDVKHLLQDTDVTYAKVSRSALIYHGFRAANADMDLHPKEAEAIRNLAKKLGLTDEQIEEIRLLAEEDEKLRQKRARITLPGGFDHFVTHLNKQHP